MKTLFTFQDKLLHSTSSPSPWKPIRPFLTPITPIKNPYLPPRTWKLAAHSKGFGTANSGKRKMTKYKESDSPKQRNEREEEEEGESESDEKIPDEVMERILLRILVNVGVPVVIGLAVLQGLSVVKEHNWWQVPRWLPILTLFLSFGASVLGIAYGSLSTSWDTEDKGSTLGFEEFQKNWAEMWKETDDQ